MKYKEVCPWMQAAYTQVRAKPDSLEVLLTNLNPGTTYEIKVIIFFNNNLVLKYCLYFKGEGAFPIWSSLYSSTEVPEE